MNDIRERLKKLPENRKRIVLIGVGIVCLLILLVFESGDSDKTEVTSGQAATLPDEYVERTEKQLKTILSQVEGAGEVNVMITLESCFENVYARDYATATESRTDSSDSDITEELVVVKGSDGEEGVVIKVYEPVVKGVAVVCEGADNINVKSAITETVCALFDISSAKVSVTKGQKER